MENEIHIAHNVDISILFIIIWNNRQHKYCQLEVNVYHSQIGKVLWATVSKHGFHQSSTLRP